jgi:phospholipid/cholesterol/gamma-HCH transport system permease protein
MKFNQEIDALKTMGIVPAELLILPRLIGLMIALPLLTIWADFFGILGGIVMSKNMLDINAYDFIQRFGNVISISPLMIGISKAPVFALIIASIGCYQGLQVGSSATSVGRQTTRSVVQAIFFIIVADAIFSILFSHFKI